MTVNMKKKDKNKMSNTTYEVALISENDAIELARKEEPAFKCDSNGNFYTYEDIAKDNGVSYTLENITESDNDSMFIVEWNGTSPVFKKRKMFPR